jgi:hypothetical protein
VLGIPLEIASGWYLKSVRVGGRETVDEPVDFGFGTDRIDDIELVLSSRGATVTGSLRGTARQPYSVAIFSTAPEHWFARSARVRLASAGPDGRFKVDSLPPGTYYAAAIPPVGDAGLRNWESVVSLDDLLPKATRITIDEGQTLDVTLTRR